MKKNTNIQLAINDYLQGSSISIASKKHEVSKTTLQRNLKSLNLTRKYTTKKNTLPLFKSGKLKAIDVYVLDNRVYYSCQCECGSQLRMRKRDYGTITECGNCRTTGSGNHNWKGCGELSGTCWKHIKSKIVRKSRTLEFDITQEYAWELYQEQDAQCALTNLPIPFPDKVSKGNFPSLDRIDSSKGYIKGNVQWVHKDINLMKWDLSQNRFIKLCKLVAAKNKEIL